MERNLLLKRQKVAHGLSSLTPHNSDLKGEGEGKESDQARGRHQKSRKKKEAQ